MKWLDSKTSHVNDGAKHQSCTGSEFNKNLFFQVETHSRNRIKSFDRVSKQLPI